MKSMTVFVCGLVAVAALGISSCGQDSKASNAPADAGPIPEGGSYWGYYPPNFNRYYLRKGDEVCTFVAPSDQSAGNWGTITSTVDGAQEFETGMGVETLRLTADGALDASGPFGQFLLYPIDRDQVIEATGSASIAQIEAMCGGYQKAD